MSHVNGAGTYSSYEPAQTLLNIETGIYETFPPIVTTGILVGDARRNSNMTGGRWCCNSCGSEAWLA